MYIKYLLVPALLFALIASPVLAEHSEGEEAGHDAPNKPGLFPNAQERREKAEEHRAEFKANIEERKDQIASSTDARRAEFRENVGERRAQFASSTAERWGEWKEKMGERRANFASTTALRKANLAENIKERVLNRAEHAAGLLDAMIARLNGLALRIESRITLLNEDGVDTSAAEAALADAVTAVDEAESAVADLKAGFTAALESENPREALQALKPTGEAAKTAIREAHQALMEAVKALPKVEAATSGE